MDQETVQGASNLIKWSLVACLCSFTGCLYTTDYKHYLAFQNHRRDLNSLSQLQDGEYVDMRLIKGKSSASKEEVGIR